MELWIRSQDKKMLSKTMYIEYSEWNKEHRIYINGEVYGKYKTKKRAIEVLDEIQKKITPVTIIKQTHPTKYIDDKKTISDAVLYIREDVDIREVGMIIYEMPEE